MSRTVRNRKEAFDNPGVGQAITSRERTIAGALPPSFNYGGLDRLAVGSSFHTTDPGENIAVGSVAPLAENVDTTSLGTT